MATSKAFLWWSLAAVLVAVSTLGFSAVPGASLQEPGRVVWEQPFWVLDGFGGIHSLAGAPTLYGTYFGWDIARELEIINAHCATGQIQAVVLDGFGGVHKVSWFSGFQEGTLPGTPLWGWDVARDVVFYIDPDRIWHESCFKM